MSTITPETSTNKINLPNLPNPRIDRTKKKVRINKTFVDKVKPPAKGQAFHRDDSITGFALRITAKGTKSFVLEKRIKGKVRRQTLGRYPNITAEQARKEILIILGKIAKGDDPIAERQSERLLETTLEECFEDYLQARKNLSPRTIKDYTHFMEKIFKSWKRKRLIDIDKNMISKRHAEIGKDSGHAHANHAMRVLRAMFNFAMAQYENDRGEPIIKFNPVDRLTQTRAWYREERRRTLIRSHQLFDWYQAVLSLKETEEGAHAADLLVLLLFTGLRRQEGISMQWDQVDLIGRTLTIPDTKNREPLTLPLSDFLYDLLQSRAEQKINEYVFPGIGITGHLIETKKPITKVRERSGVEFRLHDLRRTFITIADSLDLSYYAIKHLINHKIGGDVTAGYIVHDVERLRDPMQKISDYILKATHQDMHPNIIALNR